MTDSFFDFSGSGDQTFEEDDDTDYDALNEETFGEDLPSTDWEQQHEQLASELEKRNSFDDDSNELSERIANFLLNDEGEEMETSSHDRPSHLVQPNSRPSHAGQSIAPPPASVNKWWPNGAPPNMTKQANNTNATPPMQAWGWQKHPGTQLTTANVAPKITRKPPPVIVSVTELEEKLRREVAEEKMRKEAAKAAAIKAFMEHDNGDMQRPPNPNHQIQNGNYPRGRGPGGPMVNRGRHRPEMMADQPFHNVRHPYPPAYPGIRPPLCYPGPMNPRYFDPRLMHPPGAGPSRHLRLNHPNQFFQNQHPPYGRPDPQPPGDEYAGLMSPQEKHWLTSIQMLQLNSNHPFQDDYYFTMYQHRQGSSGRKVSGSHNQKREQPPQKPASTYAPLQFENSLGKLQIGSVTAPRKIIDMDLVESLDHNTNKNDRKTKQILLEIEEMYGYVLVIEDQFNPLNLAKKDIDIVALQEKMINMLIAPGKLVAYLSTGKGRKLVARMLPNLLFPSKLIHELLMDLVFITRKDSENTMLTCLPYIRNYLSTASLETLVEITKQYDNSFLLSNKFTVSVMANLIERADQVRADCTDEEVLNEWSLFLIRLLESTRLFSQLERPVVAVAKHIVVRHFAPVADQVTPTEMNILIPLLQSLDPPPAPSSENPKI